jgi:hypothetical protein
MWIVVVVVVVVVVTAAAAVAAVVRRLGCMGSVVDEWNVRVENWWIDSDWRKPKNWEEPVSVSSCPSRIPHWLALHRNRTSVATAMRVIWAVPGLAVVSAAVKVQQSLYSPWTQTDGMDLQLHSFFTVPLMGGEWPATSPGRLTPGKRSPVTQWSFAYTLAVFWESAMLSVF